MAMVAAPIPYAFALKHGVLLAGERDGAPLVALRDGADPRILIEVRRHLTRAFAVDPVSASRFDELLADHYAMDSRAAMAGAIAAGEDSLDLLATDLPTAEDLLDSADDAPAIRLINGIIADAARQGVSDIHIEPYESGLVVHR
jgi:general secretion pathway protein E